VLISVPTIIELQTLSQFDLDCYLSVFGGKSRFVAFPALILFSCPAFLMTLDEILE